MAVCGKMADPYTVPDRVHEFTGPVVRCELPAEHEGSHRVSFKTPERRGLETYSWRDREQSMRRLIGLTPDEQDAMLAGVGRKVVSVEHEMMGDGEALLIVFEGGDALAVEAKGQLDLTHLSPLTVNVVRMQWSNPAPADGLPLFAVAKQGTSVAVTREERRGWRRLKGPWYRLRGWWGF